MRIRAILGTTWGKIGAVFAFLISAIGVYKVYVEIYNIYLETFPELHAFATPSDFHSLSFSVKNVSKLFSIKLVNSNCLVIREITDNPMAIIRNNSVIKPLDVTLTPLNIPANVNCPLAVTMAHRDAYGNIQIETNEVRVLIARVTLDYKVGRFDNYLWNQSQSQSFVWKNGKWFEGEMY